MFRFLVILFYIFLFSEAAYSELNSEGIIHEVKVEGNQDSSSSGQLRFFTGSSKVSINDALAKAIKSCKRNGERLVCKIYSGRKILKDGSIINFTKSEIKSEKQKIQITKKSYLDLLEVLEKAKESNISIDLELTSKQHGYKNFKSFVKDFKKKNNIKRLSVEDAEIYFVGHDSNLQIIESKENLDKLHELILNNKTLKRHTSYFKKKNSNKIKWLAIAVDYKKEMAKITKDPNLKKISPFPWGWAPTFAGQAILNCEREKDDLGIKIGPECILVDISMNEEHLNVILPMEKIEMCKKNSLRLFPDLYKIADKEFRDKRYKYYCQSVLFSLDEIPLKERSLNLISKEIKKNEFLYRELEENNPLLVKVKKDEQEKKRLKIEKLEAKRKIEEEKKKLEKEKLEAKRKAEEEKLEAKRKAEEEKLEAKRKAEEEKKKLAEEKIKQQKALDEKKLSLLSAKPIEEIAKKALIDIQKFIKNNPDEFDILEISEFFIKTKPILENSFNEQLEKDLNSLIRFVQTSENFQIYLKEIEIKEREKNLKYIDEKLSLINEQIAIVTNFLYEEPNSIHAEIWLNSVKTAKQQLNNFNSLDDLLASSNDLSILISNQENLVKLNVDSKKLIIELKDYLAENLTTDLAPKILEQIDSINKSIETEDQSQIKIANQNAEILLEPKRKIKAEKEKLDAKRRYEKYKKEKKELEAKQKAEKEKKTKIAKSFKTNYDSIMDAYHSDVDKFLNLVPKIRNNARRMSYDTYATCSIATIYLTTQEAQGYIKLNSETQLTWAITLKLTQIFQKHHLSKGFPQSVLDEIINSKKSMFIHNGENFKLSLIKECSDWVDRMVAKSK